METSGFLFAEPTLLLVFAVKFGKHGICNTIYFIGRCENLVNMAGYQFGRNIRTRLNRLERRPVSQKSAKSSNSATLATDNVRTISSRACC